MGVEGLGTTAATHVLMLADGTLHAARKGHFAHASCSAKADLGWMLGIARLHDQRDIHLVISSRASCGRAAACVGAGLGSLYIEAPIPKFKGHQSILA